MVVAPLFLLRTAIERLALETDNIVDLQSAWCQVLYLYVFHLPTHPHIPRYRKIFTNNDSFKTRVEQVLPNGAPGIDLLLAVGCVKQQQEKGGTPTTTTKNDGIVLEWKPTLSLLFESGQEAIPILQYAAAALEYQRDHDGLHQPEVLLTRRAGAHLVLPNGTVRTSHYDAALRYHASVEPL